jgi:RNA polymerase sigma-70 factor (ECF subfamily)
VTLADTQTFLRRSLEGDDRARSQLLERLRPRVYLWVQARLSASLRARIEPDDITQDVLMAAHKGFAGFRGDDPRGFHAWLFRIAENRIRDAADHFSAQKRQAVPLASPSQTSPSSAALRREVAEHVNAAVVVLPDDYRQVILLRRIEEQEFEQVAEVMGRSVNAVRILYCRALKALRAALATSGYETDAGRSR